MKIWVLTWECHHDYYNSYYETAEKAYDALIESFNEEMEDIAANELDCEEDKKDFEEYRNNELAKIKEAKRGKVSGFTWDSDYAIYTIEEKEVL